MLAISDQNGNVVSGFVVDAWGNVIDGAVAENPYVYQGGMGYWQDLDLGLSYVRARWLDPKTGRWMSQDPNLDEFAYQYADNQPTAQTDASGEAPDIASATSEFWELVYKLAPGLRPAPTSETRSAGHGAGHPTPTIAKVTPPRQTPTSPKHPGTPVGPTSHGRPSHLGTPKPRNPRPNRHFPHPQNSVRNAWPSTDLNRIRQEDTEDEREFRMAGIGSLAHDPSRALTDDEERQYQVMKLAGPKIGQGITTGVAMLGAGIAVAFLSVPVAITLGIGALAALGVSGYDAYTSRQLEAAEANRFDIPSSYTARVALSDTLTLSGYLSLYSGTSLETGEDESYEIQSDRWAASTTNAALLPFGALTEPIKPTKSFWPQRSFSQWLSDTRTTMRARIPTRSVILPPDDPILDNNFYSALLADHPTAIDFARQYKGKMSITRAIQKQAGANRVDFSSKLAARIRASRIRRLYDIQIVSDRPDAEVKALMRRLKRPKDPSERNMIDVAQIAAAQYHKVGLATGDVKLYKNALSILPALDQQGNAALHFRVFAREGEDESIAYNAMIDYLQKRIAHPKGYGLPGSPALPNDLDPYLLTGTSWKK